MRSMHVGDTAKPMRQYFKDVYALEFALFLAPVPLATVLLGWFAWHALRSTAEATPFLGAMALFVVSYVGIAISLFPMIVPYHFTL